jgi:hypothetical protein
MVHCKVPTAGKDRHSSLIIHVKTGSVIKQLPIKYILGVRSQKDNTGEA